MSLAARPPVKAYARLGLHEGSSALSSGSAGGELEEKDEADSGDDDDDNASTRSGRKRIRARLRRRAIARGGLAEAIAGTTWTNAVWAAFMADTFPGLFLSGQPHQLTRRTAPHSAIIGSGRGAERRASRDDSGSGSEDD